MMLSFIFICVIASCFSLVIAGNNGAAKVQLRASSSSATKAQKKEIAQSVINSVVEKSRTRGYIFHQKSTKEIEEIALTELVAYDPAFSGGWWVGIQSYVDSTACSNTAETFAADYDASFCYVFQAQTLSGTVYNSYAALSTSDCQNWATGFYTNKKCSGTPAMQSSKVQDEIKPNTCTLDTSDFSNSFIATCTKGQIGSPYKKDVVVIAAYDQSETCGGKISSEVYIPANTCISGTGESAGTSTRLDKVLSRGVAEVARKGYPCANCICAPTTNDVISGLCDPGNYVAHVDDDAEIYIFSENYDSASEIFYESYEVVNSAIGDVVNVGLSLALVVAVSFGLLI